MKRKTLQELNTEVATLKALVLDLLSIAIAHDDLSHIDMPAWEASVDTYARCYEYQQRRLEGKEL
jgi:hypothetical protein